MAAQFRVAAICTGNICRSPMAEVVLKHLVAEDPSLSGHVRVTSAGTARWHVGTAMDARARRALDRFGYDAPGSLARYADADYLNDQDLILVMTRDHLEEVTSRRTRAAADVLLWRSPADGAVELDVADPYYGDDAAFDDCLAVLRASGPRWREEFRRRLGGRSSEA